MQLTHSSYDVNTSAHHTLLPSIRIIKTYVNTGSGKAAKGIKFIAQNMKEYGRSCSEFQVHTNIYM